MLWFVYENPYFLNKVNYKLQMEFTNYTMRQNEKN